MGTTSTSDIIVIGAGVTGLNIALQLAHRGFERVLVLEKGRGPGEGSSGASSAICRHLYTHDEMIWLARDGIDVYRNWHEYVDSKHPPRAQFQDTGVLWLGGESTSWGNSQVDRLGSMGIAAQLLTDAELIERFPAINPCGLAPDFDTGEEHQCAGSNAHLFESSGGYMDPQYVLEDLAEALAYRGMPVQFNQQVVGLTMQDSRVTGVTCADGTQHEAELVINAAGPWCNGLLEQAGVPPLWSFVPTRIQVLYLPRPEEIVGDIPVCADLAAGVYFRPQNRGAQLVVGSTRPEDEAEAVDDPDEFNMLADDEFQQRTLHALHHRLPDLPYRGRISSYCGLYTVNREDMHPVIGPSPVDGLFIANGFSGHGFKIAPAVGSMAAQMISGITLPGDTQVDPAFFCWDREAIALQSKSVLA